MTIEVDLHLRRGGFHLDAAFSAGAGLTALFGRSGSGKSTIVDLIAGLARPDRGRISVDGEILLDTTKGVDVPTYRRRIGYVFQEARLLPHLSVAQNLGFGRWFARHRLGEEISDSEFGDIVALLGIEGLLGRRPSGLSGGERQRVAIGRALLSCPRLLLMDEPLSALDEARKREILPYVERLRDEAGLPIVYVSHSIAEVARLASTIVMMEAGRIVASGPAETVLLRHDLMPAFADAGSLLAMVVESHDDTAGLTRLTGAAGVLSVPLLPFAPGRRVRLRVPARDVIVALKEPTGLSARNILTGHIAAVSESGGAAIVEIDCKGAMLSARLTGASVRDLALVPGLPVYAIVKSVAFDPVEIGIQGPRAIEI